ncbi:MAG: DUF481 domain-containing protein [Parvularculaceae bacterium]
MKFTPMLAFGLILASPAFAADPPPALAQAMVDAAAESQDAAQIHAVSEAAKKVFADDAQAIEAYAAALIAALTPEPAPEKVVETAVVELDAAKDGDADAQYGVFAFSPWDGKIAASAVVANGNSENVAIGVLVDARREAGDFAHNFKANFDTGRSDGVQNLKRWGAAYQLDYNFSDRTYAFGRLSYVEDEFSGFDYRLFAGAGLGHYYFKSDALTWKVEAGPGYQYSPIDDTRAISKEFAMYAASETDWVIRDGLKLEQDFSVTWTSPTTTLTSLTALTAAITQTISAGMGYEVRYETDPPDLRKHTDTVLRANLAVGF